MFTKMIFSDFFGARVREFGQSQYFCPGLQFFRSLVNIALHEKSEKFNKNSKVWFLCKK